MKALPGIIGLFMAIAVTLYGMAEAPEYGTLIGIVGAAVALLCVGELARATYMDGVFFEIGVGGLVMFFALGAFLMLPSLAQPLVDNLPDGPMRAVFDRLDLFSYVGMLVVIGGFFVQLVRRWRQG